MKFPNARLIINWGSLLWILSFSAGSEAAHCVETRLQVMGRNNRMHLLPLSTCRALLPEQTVRICKCERAQVKSEDFPSMFCPCPPLERIRKLDGCMSDCWVCMLLIISSFLDGESNVSRQELEVPMAPLCRPSVSGLVCVGWGPELWGKLFHRTGPDFLWLREMCSQLQQRRVVSPQHTRGFF